MFAIGVAISPVPIIAVILMLFSGRAKVNGPMLRGGGSRCLRWSAAPHTSSWDAGNTSTDSAAADGVSAQIVFGALLPALATQSAICPAPEPSRRCRKWMASIRRVRLHGRSGSACCWGVNPKNLLLAAGAGSALAVTGPSAAEAVVSLIVFVVRGSFTIAGRSSST